MIAPPMRLFPPSRLTGDVGRDMIERSDPAGDRPAAVAYTWAMVADSSDTLPVGSNTLPVGARPSPWSRRAFVFNAFVAWLGIGLNMIFSIFDLYAKGEPEPTLYGGWPDGLAGAPGRVLDSLSYFTIWSNIVVGIAMTLLVTRPRQFTESRRALHLSALLMITVTGIVYQVLLAPTADVQGVGYITNTLEHIITPIATPIVWLIFGPRGWIDRKAVLGSFVIPLAWIGWMLLRGAVSGRYPYDFADVTTYGYLPVLRTSVLVLLFGLVVDLVYWGLDRVLGRGSTPEVQPTPDPASS